MRGTGYPNVTLGCGLDGDQLPELSCVDTELKVADAFVPIERIAVKQTITIRASITAYSTAVGPSSD